jgi:hypothetical protein
MSPSLYGIALRKVRHDAVGERFVIMRRRGTDGWLIADEFGEVDGEAAWGILADHGLLAERIALLLDDARERFTPPDAGVSPASRAS